MIKNVQTQSKQQTFLHKTSLCLEITSMPTHAFYFKGVSHCVLIFYRASQQLVDSIC